tara:strand:+ start:761 stop:937 length:177 start_codon:yes stop_codon:yes gene_type:complete
MSFVKAKYPNYAEWAKIKQLAEAGYDAEYISQATSVQVTGFKKYLDDMKKGKAKKKAE